MRIKLLVILLILSLIPSVYAAQCNDGIDNDANGCKDYPADSGCSNANDNSETGGYCYCSALSGACCSSGQLCSGGFATSRDCAGLCCLSGSCYYATHKECSGSSCITVSGLGADECNINSDCVATTHKVCSGSSCITIAGTGTDECTSDTECVSPRHLACSSGQCIYVEGAGSDECSNNAQCEATCGDRLCEGEETCQSCSIDCGICLIGQLNIVVQNPTNNQILKRGPLDIYIIPYMGAAKASYVSAEVISDLFGKKLILESDYPLTGKGYWGIQTEISKAIMPGEYVITINAQTTDSSDSEVIKVVVNPNLTINLQKSLKQSYSKGERIYFEGNVIDAAGIKQINKSISIKLINKDTRILDKTIWLDNLGSFKEDYLISFADPDGDWKVMIQTQDKYGNYGELVYNIPVRTPVGVAYYTINFLNPLTGAKYKRGDIIPVSIDVKEENKLVKNASVSFLTPFGDYINLNEIKEGTYSGEYKIPLNAPTGNYRLAVQAVKKDDKEIVRAGGNSIPLVIEPVELTINILSKERTYTNTKIKLSVKVVDSEGNAIKGASAFAELSNNEKVELFEGGDGVYSAYYSVKPEDIGTLTANYKVNDAEGNYVLSEKQIFITKANAVEVVIYNVRGYASRYWYAIIAILLIASVITMPEVSRKIKIARLRKAEKEQKTAKEMQIETERKYYKEKSINKEEFNTLMKDYEERITRSKEEQKNLEEQLSKKLKRIKKK